MEDYASNSHKSKGILRQEETTEETRKVNKVVKGTAKVSKKTGAQKLASTFLAEDVDSVKSYAAGVFVSTIKKAISDIIANGVDILLFGDGGRSNRFNRTSSGSSINYDRYYERSNNQRRGPISVKATSGFDYNPIEFETRGDAEAALSELDILMETYEIISVMDLYSAAGLGCDWTYQNFGWTDISTAKVVPFRSGYTIKLPRPLPIK